MEMFENVEPLGPGDTELLAELREVLVRHGALERFGLTLLHRHFDLEHGELLVEAADQNSRTLRTRPVGEDQSADDAIATSWSFVADSADPVVRLVCWPVRDRDGNVVGHML